MTPFYLHHQTTLGLCVDDVVQKTVGNPPGVAHLLLILFGFMLALVAYTEKLAFPLPVEAGRYELCLNACFLKMSFAKNIALSDR